jgi:hypothetical protein
MPNIKKRKFKHTICSSIKDEEQPNLLASGPAFELETEQKVPALVAQSLQFVNSEGGEILLSLLSELERQNT